MWPLLASLSGAVWGAGAGHYITHMWQGWHGEHTGFLSEPLPACTAQCGGQGCVSCPLQGQSSEPTELISPVGASSKKIG